MLKLKFQAQSTKKPPVVKSCHIKILIAESHTFHLAIYA